MRPPRGKQKLLDAALTLFESQGYFSTTVEQITQEAGVSKGLVYNYFSSKEELLAGLIESATSQMASVAETLDSSGPIEESLTRFLDRYLGYLKTEKRFLKLQLTLMLMPELQQVVIEPQQTRAALLLKMLSDWFRQAGVSQPKAKARLFLAMLDGVALHYLCIYEQYPLNTMKPMLVQATRDLCRAKNKERTMIQVKKMESQDHLTKLKKQYAQQTTAPLDGMWLCGFVPMASHFGCYEGDELVGFFCVNDEGYLLQFLVNQNCQSQSSQLFESILHRDDVPSGNIKGAFVSTAEPYLLSLCLDCFSKFDVNALMYQLDGGIREISHENTLSMTTVEPSQLSDAVEFAVASIGAPADWLTGYFTNLINRQELFGVWTNGRLVATGESRGYDEYQTEYADVGVIVAESERGKGMATRVLRQLVMMNESKGLKSICSTEQKNIAAQKQLVEQASLRAIELFSFMQTADVV